MRKEHPHMVQLGDWVCLCRGVCIQSNIFVARVLHFSAFVSDEVTENGFTYISFNVRVALNWLFLGDTNRIIAEVS